MDYDCLTFGVGDLVEARGMVVVNDRGTWLSPLQGEAASFMPGPPSEGVDALRLRTDEGVSLVPGLTLIVGEYLGDAIRVMSVHTFTRTIFRRSPQGRLRAGQDLTQEADDAWEHLRTRMRAWRIRGLSHRIEGPGLDVLADWVNPTFAAWLNVQTGGIIDVDVSIRPLGFETS